MLEECRQVMMRYATAQDHGKADEFAELFAEEAVWERTDGDMVGRSTILAHLERTSQTRKGSIRHLVTTLDIVQNLEGEARATAYVLVYRADERESPRLTAVFDYDTTLIHVGDRWLIARHRSQILK